MQPLSRSQKRVVAGMAIGVAALVGMAIWSVASSIVPIDGDIELIGEMPARTNNRVLTLNIKNTSPTSPSMYINNQFYKLDDGPNEVEYNLIEGPNTLEFRLSPAEGKQSDVVLTQRVTLDTKGPEKGFLFHRNLDGDTAETYTLSIGNAQSYGDHIWVNFPITGQINTPTSPSQGTITQIRLDGKVVPIKTDGTINTRMSLYVVWGDNIYDIEATDDLGNVGLDTLPITWEEVETSQINDLEDRLDDLEGEIY